MTEGRALNRVSVCVRLPPSHSSRGKWGAVSVENKIKKWTSETVEILYKGGLAGWSWSILRAGCFRGLGGEKENKGCLGLGGGREAPKPLGTEGSHFISQGETQATCNTCPVVLIPERPNYHLKIIAWMWSQSKGCLSKRVWNPEAF